MSSKVFVQWFVLIIIMASAFVMFISLHAYDYPLGKALIGCTIIWLVCAILLMIISIRSARP